MKIGTKAAQFLFWEYINPNFKESMVQKVLTSATSCSLQLDQAGITSNEPVIVDLLRSPGIDSSMAGRYDNPVGRTVPPRYIGWRNRFLGSINVYKYGLGVPLNGECQENQCGQYPSTAADSGYQAAWVKSYCTTTSLTLFTLYFPYILLLSALALGTQQQIHK